MQYYSPETGMNLKCFSGKYKPESKEYKKNYEKNGQLNERTTYLYVTNHKSRSNLFEKSFEVLFKIDG